MGFLDDAGVVGIKPEAPDFSVANGVYPAMVSESKTDLFNGVSKWQITYRIHPDVDTFGGRTVSEWFNLTASIPEEQKQFLVRRLASLSISPEQQKTLEPADIIGTEVTITVRNKPSADGTKVYTNITNVRLGSTKPAPSADALVNF